MSSVSPSLLLARSLAHTAAQPATVRARGSLDDFDPLPDGSVRIRGWLLHPAHACDSARIFVDGNVVGECSLSRRDDVASTWPHVATTQRSGFEIEAVLPPPTGAVRTVSVLGTGAGTPSVEYRAQRRVVDVPLAVPGPELLQRVTGNQDPVAYARIGLDAAMDLLRAITRHRRLCDVRRVLDWGCGPGRVSAQLAQLLPTAQVTGTDLDAEAVRWCNEHVRAGAFQVTRPQPPLPFPDQSFDAIIAVSVMTHLDWEVQERWLREIHRVLRPGGIFAASVHGTFAAAYWPKMEATLRARGFVADTLDQSLRGIAPRGFYRATFQTPQFTRDYWSRTLEVVAYEEAGLTGFQDLVLARRPG